MHLFDVDHVFLSFSSKTARSLSIAILLVGQILEQLMSQFSAVEIALQQLLQNVWIRCLKFNFYR